MRNIILLSLGLIWAHTVCAQSCQDAVPYSTDPDHLTIWTGEEYQPIFIKGMNFGVSVPGKFPGELELSDERYYRWISEIKEAGFNCIRLYTLHFPHFYDILDSFNRAHPNHPMLIFQGVWLEEEVPNYDEDLYTLSPYFSQEIEENVDCVHGNRTIDPRLGKAYGTYTTDVSEWVLGYIIGREIYPTEVLHTNASHPQDSVYSGAHFSISSASASETWMTSMLDHLVAYERAGYDTERPVSSSSWPTLDPLSHPEEMNEFEDTATINLASMELTDAPAGYFASYHAYPYYPDFVSDDPNYQGVFDDYGPNSYLAYLRDLKSHYERFPLVIAEYGVPSSWGIAHYTSNGMNHGGFTELEQGQTNLRILGNIDSSGCAGGVQFAWIDEWFKRTWITDPMDYLADRRILWHNVTAAEQNFGLIAFDRDTNYASWANFPNQPITEIHTKVDYDFLHLQLDLDTPLNLLDTIWVALDTYGDSIGELILPSGDTVVNRPEFALRITNFSAELYVTEAYDLFGNWHGTAGSEQLFRSVASEGEPWKLVRWKNNSGYSQVQYIGDLNLQSATLPSSSKDAVIIGDEKITIKLPWTLIHFVDPSELRVIHDDRNTNAPEDTASDGVMVTVLHDHVAHTPSTRYTWNTWNTALDVTERKKTSYHVMRNGLPLFNTQAIAKCDAYEAENTFSLLITAQEGVLSNDLDLDGNNLSAVLNENAKHGNVILSNTGAFIYQPAAGFVGTDVFSYSVFDGRSISDPATVVIEVGGISGTDPTPDQEVSVEVYPNPTSNTLNYRSSTPLQTLRLFDTSGRLVSEFHVSGVQGSIDVSSYPSGIYFLQLASDDRSWVNTVSIR